MFYERSLAGLFGDIISWKESYFFAPFVSLTQKNFLSLHKRVFFNERISYYGIKGLF